MFKSLKIGTNLDRERKYGPLKKTKDSILINTTKLSKKASFMKIKAIMDRKLKSLMEIYKDLSSEANQQFQKLLNKQLSKNKIEEGKIIEGKITKITEKYIFLFIPGLKSEPVIDINEMKTIGMQDKIVEGENVPVLLRKN